MAKKAFKEPKPEREGNEIAYPREILIRSTQIAQYNLHRDILSAILSNNYYTTAQAVERIEKFLKE